jgi:asparagine synthase (glutamine-hydrolysing)
VEFILTNIAFAEEEVQSKLESIQFRGPDYRNKKSGRFTFGHLRLSILDLDIRSPTHGI